jgi:hypothetical protein
MSQPTAVIWGHKLHTHTHSYVHEGFFRAFQYLGYRTHWLDDSDDVSGLDLAGAVFLTEGVGAQWELRRALSRTDQRLRL